MPRAREPREPRADLLLGKLQSSARRFRRCMLRLLEKYDQPFEDDPLVRMATLTYETPQGLRIWGGKLIKEANTEENQNPPVKVDDRLNDPGSTMLEGREHVPNCTQVLGADSESSGANQTPEDMDVSACALMSVVPGRSLENELRRKYLSQVDILLQGEEYFKSIQERKDTPMALVSSLTPCVTPAPACSGSISAESADDPGQQAPSPLEWDPLHPCPADMTIVSRNDSSSLLESPSFEAADVTIGDLYVGMLHCMSRLLNSKPLCIISTRTYTWNPWRRHLHKNRVHMYCHRGRPARRSPRERSACCSEPGGKPGAVRDSCKNLTRRALHLTCLKVQRALPKGSKPHFQISSPAWKELQVTPRKYSSLQYLDLSTRYNFDQENRLKTLKGLISPGRNISRPRVLQDRALNIYREIEVKFNKLHQECSLYSRKQAHLAGPSESWAVDVYRGGSGIPGGPRALETHRLSSPFSREKGKRLREESENLDRRPLQAAKHVRQSSTTRSPARCVWTSDLLKKMVSDSTASSETQVAHLDWGRSRYDEIKEEFDKLHQQCCQTSPLSPSPRKASADSHFQNVQKLSLSPQWLMKRPRDSSADEAPGSVRALRATRDSQFSIKRHRLSYSHVSGDQSQELSIEPAQLVSGRESKSAPHDPPGKRTHL